MNPKHEHSETCLHSDSQGKISDLGIGVIIGVMSTIFGLLIASSLFQMK